jgi:uncharacterized alkaline shock family protein YloU
MEVYALVGPSGTGKCVSPRTEIVVKTEKNSPEKREILQLYRNKEEKMEVLSFSPAAKELIFLPVLDIYQVAGGKSLTLIGGDGQKLTVKADHPQVRIKEVEIEVVPAHDLRVGDQLIVLDGDKWRKTPLKMIEEGWEERFYSLTLPQPHLYFGNGILTHNSHRALVVAHEYEIDTVVDDGLLIQSGKIIAGSSAKREKNAIKATRRAIFIEPEHAFEVREAIKGLRPKKLLVLATSVRMADKICDTLSIPRAKKIIRIEDIATENEITLAKRIREKEGKHVIPAPTIEVKPKFSGYWIDALEIFWKGRNSDRPEKLGEKTIIRPTFTSLGKLIISENVIATIVYHEAAKVEGIKRASWVYTEMGDNGVVIRIELVLLFGRRIVDILKECQKRVKEKVEEFTGMNVIEINVLGKSMIVENSATEEG